MFTGVQLFISQSSQTLVFWWPACPILGCSFFTSVAIPQWFFSSLLFMFLGVNVDVCFFGPKPVYTVTLPRAVCLFKFGVCFIWCVHVSVTSDTFYMTFVGGGDSSVVRAPDSWLKGHGFESLLERRENFLLQGRLSVLTLISVSVPPPCYHSST